MSAYPDIVTKLFPLHSICRTHRCALTTYNLCDGQCKCRVSTSKESVVSNFSVDCGLVRDEDGALIVSTSVNDNLSLYDDATEGIYCAIVTGA